MSVGETDASVYLCAEDTRCWHCQAMHNFSGRTRYAIVNRWAPWWLSVAEFGNVHSNKSSIAPEEFHALPESVRPLLAHLVKSKHQEEQEEMGAEMGLNLIQPLNQTRSATAAKRASEGFWPDTAVGSNSHVVVKLRKASL